MIFASAAVSLLITEISTVCDLTSIAFVGCNCAKEGAITNDTIDINLIKIFIEGPEVSLKGSPTVSPVTEALCGSDFL